MIFYSLTAIAVFNELFELFLSSNVKKTKAYLRLVYFIDTNFEELKYIENFENYLELLQNFDIDQDKNIEVMGGESYNYTRKPGTLVWKRDIFITNPIQRTVNNMLTGMLAESGKLCTIGNNIFKKITKELNSKFSNVFMVYCAKGSMAIKDFINRSDSDKVFKNSDVDYMICVDPNTSNYTSVFDKIVDTIMEILFQSSDEIFESLLDTIQYVKTNIPNVKHQKCNSILDLGSMLIYGDTGNMRIQNCFITVDLYSFMLIRLKVPFNIGFAEVLDIVLPYGNYSKKKIDYINKYYTINEQL